MSMDQVGKWRTKRIKQHFYGIGYYYVKKNGEQTFLTIALPYINDITKAVVVSLHLLDSGKSYTDHYGVGHWAWNKDLNKITLEGSIGVNGYSCHCRLIDGVLYKIDNNNNKQGGQKCQT